MRWALVGVALLLAVAGLLYRGGVTFVSTLSDGTASRGAGAPGTVAAAAVESPTRADPGPGEPLAATAALAPAPSPANPAGPSPAAEPRVRPDPEGSPEQRVFKSRKALETVDAREFLRHNGAPK
jgi:hypothetical protein